LENGWVALEVGLEAEQDEAEQAHGRSSFLATAKTMTFEAPVVEGGFQLFAGRMDGCIQVVVRSFGHLKRCGSGRISWASFYSVLVLVLARVLAESWEVADMVHLPTTFGEVVFLVVIVFGQGVRSSLQSLAEDVSAQSESL
jgi:hypothetical protein